MDFASEYHFAVLGISPTDDWKAVEKAYKKKSLQCHPDKTGGSNEDFVKLKESYDFLNNRKKEITALLQKNRERIFMQQQMQKEKHEIEKELELEKERRRMDERRRQEAAEEERRKKQEEIRKLQEENKKKEAQKQREREIEEENRRIAIEQQHNFVPWGGMGHPSIYNPNIHQYPQNIYSGSNTNLHQPRPHCPYCDSVLACPNTNCPSHPRKPKSRSWHFWNES